jgi:hypothetical protein
MTTIQEINRAIVSGSFTNEQLVTISDAIRFARANLTKAKISTIRAGASVQFKSSNTGKLVTGDVTKVGRKFVIVREHGTSYGGWRVPASMLEVI